MSVLARFLLLPLLCVTVVTRGSPTTRSIDRSTPTAGSQTQMVNGDVATATPPESHFHNTIWMPKIRKVGNERKMSKTDGDLASGQSLKFKTVDDVRQPPVPPDLRGVEKPM